MKKALSLVLTVFLSLSAFKIVSSAEVTEPRTITSIELHNMKYYAAVKTEEEIRDAVFYVNFVAQYDDGTTAQYTSEDGWNDPTVTAEVSWYVQPEDEENYGTQQSLYITIDGQDYWAGYVNVEVNAFKALFRTIVTWDWVTPEVVVTAGILVTVLTIVHTIRKWVRRGALFLLGGWLITRLLPKAVAESL